MAGFSACAALLLWLLLLAQTVAGDEVLTFEPLSDFPQLPDTIQLGPCSAVSVNSRGDIFLFNRGKHPIICLDAKGKYKRSWGEGEIVTSHGLRIDVGDNVWVTDIGGHRVLKYDAQGKLLLALGTGKPGDGEDQFNQPTDIAFGKRGEFYVSDGYGNSRVLKFSPSGALSTKWGGQGKEPSQFNLPHSILVDNKGRVLVGDRENNRIQVFDGDGQLLEVWKGFAPYGMALSSAGELFVADGRANKVLLLDGHGAIARSWGETGTAPGQFQMPHMLAVDAAGNLLVAEVTGKRVQKLVRKR
jgi:DNA-binding beta-propeller fold protein YncE